MAGAGYKLFNTGDVLTAAQVNTYLMQQTVMVFASATARTTALSGVLAEGMVSYLQDTNALEVYDGSAWVASAAGDITSVTAGTGISGGGTSGAVTITNSMATEITAAGDIIVGTGSGTFDNLPIGTTGQILTADTTVSPYKVKWATASSSTPAFVGVSIYKSSDQTFSNNTQASITYDSELFDTDAFHSTSSNTDRITIPSGKGGYYLITSAVSYAQNSTGVRSLYIKINGSTTASGIDRNADGNNRTTILMTVVRNLSVGDYLTTEAYQTSGGNLAVSSLSYLTYFSAQFLGA
jgi:hypothetical protein